MNETKKVLLQHFDMKDLGDASFALGIEINCDKSWGFLSLSQKSYVENVIKIFNIAACFYSSTPIQKCKVHLKLSVLKMMKRNLE